MIEYTARSGMIVEAANGFNEGPPFVRFNLPREHANDIQFGKAIMLTVEVEDD